jgi:lysine N6-hydroxylase
MCLLTSNMTTYWADDIILATGYTPAYQGLLHNLTNEYSDLKKVQINDDFSLQWEHGDTNKIFIQNGAKDSHGVSDPNISLAAWRASVIANGLFGEEIYKTQFKSLVEY